jgi:WD40 repeat protein
LGTAGQSASKTVTCLAFSPDGKSLLAFDADRRLTVWDLPAGTPRAAFGSDQPADTVAFTHFGDCLATAVYDADGGRKTVFRVWDLRTGERVRQREFDEIGKPTFLAASADGGTVSARQRGVSRLWDLKTGERVDPEGLPTSLADVAFAAGGKDLILGGQTDRVVVWDGAARRVRYTIHEEGAASSRFAVSPNGRVLGVSFGNGPAVAVLYDFDSGEIVRPFGVRRNPASPDVGIVRTVRTPNRKGGKVEGPSPMAFSPDGRCVAAAEDGGAVHVWRIDTGEELSRFAAGGRVGALAFSPDGKRLACAVAAAVLVLDMSANAGKYGQPATPPTPGQLEELWSDLAGRDGARAVRAVWQMADAPGPAVAFLARRMYPLSLDPQRVEQWVKDLQDPRYATRARAHDELARLDEAARPWLEKQLENNPGVEMRRRLELLLQPLDGPLPGSEKMRLLRGVEVLEHVGNAEACRVLERLAGGDAGVWLTGHARAVLERVRKHRIGD